MEMKRDAPVDALLAEIGRRRFGLGHLQTCQYFAAPFGPLAGGQTYATALKLEAGFDMVRLVYCNDQAAPFEVTRACVATAASIGAGGAPCDPAGVATHWTAVTFGPARAGEPPGSRTSRLVVPGVAVAGQPVFAVSDWMVLPSVAPIEDDGRPWLLTRSFMDGEGRCVLVRPEDFGAFADPAQGMGRAVEAFHQQGDFVSVPAPMDAARPYGFMAPVAVQYRTRSAGMTVMCVGDSITCGSGTASRYSGWGLRACAEMSRPDRPVSYVNAGWSGATTAAFHAMAKNYLELMPSGLVAIAPFSLNDRYDDANAAALAEAGLGSALEVAIVAAQGGRLPALVTPLPWAGANAVVDQARGDVAAAVRAFGARGGVVVDLAPVVSDASRPARLRAAFDTDGLLPNEAANAAMARVLAAVIASELDGDSVTRVAECGTDAVAEPVAPSAPVVRETETVMAAETAVVQAPAGATKPDLVMGLCTGYSLDKIEAFLASLFHLDANIELCLFSRDMDPAFDAVARQHGIIICDPTDYLVPGVHPMISRFTMYRDFLAESGDRYGQVMLSDIRDVLFQSNPFVAPREREVVFAAEDVRFANNDVNAMWVREVAGTEVLAEIAAMQVSCAGTTLGSVAGIRRYLEAMCDLSVSMGFDRARNYDQGVHNYLVSKLRPDWGALDPQDRVFNTVGCTSPERVTIVDGVVLVDGLAPPVVHQWDRHPAMVELTVVDPRFRLTRAVSLELEPAIGPDTRTLAATGAIETIEIDPAGPRSRGGFLHADAIDTAMARFGDLFTKPEFKTYRNAGLVAVRLRDLAVIGTDAVVLHAGKVIPDTLVHVSFWSANSAVAAFEPRTSLRLKAAMPMRRRLTGRPYFIGFSAAWPNYAHWMQQTLPMLTAYVGLRARVPGLRLLVPAFKDGSFQAQTLRLLGIEDSEIETIAPGELVGIDDGFTMTLPDIWSVPGYVGAAAAQLSAAAPRVTDGGAGGRVYLHRDVAARRVSNFDAVSAVLQRYGFVVVSFEQTPLAEQIAVMGGARLFIGEHGAGLANVLFCQPGARVLELFNPVCVQPAFWTLAGVSGLDYGFVVGRHVATEYRPEPDWNSAYEVPLDRLETAIKAMIGESEAVAPTASAPVRAEVPSVLGSLGIAVGYNPVISAGMLKGAKPVVAEPAPVAAVVPAPVPAPEPAPVAPAGVAEMRFTGPGLLEIGDVRFALQRVPSETTDERVLLFKDEGFLRDFTRALAATGARRVFEFGIHHGGGALFLTLLLGIEKYVGIDQMARSEMFDRIMTRAPAGQRITGHFETAQDSLDLIRGIMQAEFGDTPPDLIIDDASHHYELTKRSFEIAFPYLADGGHYVIENWSWAHWPENQGGGPGWGSVVAMSNLILELVLLLPSSDVIEAIEVRQGFVVIKKKKSRFHHDLLNIDGSLRLRGRHLNKI